MVREQLENLIRSVYPELRAMAGRFLRREREHHTLQPTALVHETLMRLFKSPPNPEIPPGEFMALSAHQTRHVLTDYARARRAQRRGGESFHRSLSALDSIESCRDDELLALSEALDRLGVLDERLLAVVELKMFSGCTNNETAAIPGVSMGTVEI